MQLVYRRDCYCILVYRILNSNCVHLLACHVILTVLGLRGLSGAMLRAKSSTIGYAGDDSDSLGVQHSYM